MKLFRIIMALCVLVSAQNNLFGLPPRRGAQPAAPTQTGPKKGAPQKPVLADLVDRALASNKSAKNLSTAQLTQLRNAFKGQLQKVEVINETPAQIVGALLGGDLSNFYVDNKLDMNAVNAMAKKLYNTIPAGIRSGLVDMTLFTNENSNLEKEQLDRLRQALRSQLERSEITETQAPKKIVETLLGGDLSRFYSNNKLDMNAVKLVVDELRAVPASIRSGLVDMTLFTNENSNLEKEQLDRLRQALRSQLERSEITETQAPKKIVETLLGGDLARFYSNNKLDMNAVKLAVDELRAVPASVRSGLVEMTLFTNENSNLEKEQLDRLRQAFRSQLERSEITQVQTPEKIVESLLGGDLSRLYSNNMLDINMVNMIADELRNKVSAKTRSGLVGMVLLRNKNANITDFQLSELQKALLKRLEGSDLGYTSEIQQERLGAANEKVKNAVKETFGTTANLGKFFNADETINQKELGLVYKHLTELQDKNSTLSNQEMIDTINSVLASNIITDDFLKVDLSSWFENAFKRKKENSRELAFIKLVSNADAKQAIEKAFGDDVDVNKFFNFDKTISEDAVNSTYQMLANSQNVSNEEMLSMIKTAIMNNKNIKSNRKEALIGRFEEAFVGKKKGSNVSVNDITGESSEASKSVEETTKTMKKSQQLRDLVADVFSGDLDQFIGTQTINSLSGLNASNISLAAKGLIDFQKDSGISMDNLKALVEKTLADNKTDSVNPEQKEKIRAYFIHRLDMAALA